jgi:hypothetical protein
VSASPVKVLESDIFGKHGAGTDARECVARWREKKNIATQLEFMLINFNPTTRWSVIPDSVPGTLHRIVTYY